MKRRKREMRDYIEDRADCYTHLLSRKTSNRSSRRNNVRKRNCWYLIAMSLKMLLKVPYPQPIQGIGLNGLRLNTLPRFIASLKRPSCVGGRERRMRLPSTLLTKCIKLASLLHHPKIRIRKSCFLKRDTATCRHPLTSLILWKFRCAKTLIQRIL